MYFSVDTVPPTAKVNIPYNIKKVNSFAAPGAECRPVTPQPVSLARRCIKCNIAASKLVKRLCSRCYGYAYRQQHAKPKAQIADKYDPADTIEILGDKLFRIESAYACLGSIKDVSTKCLLRSEIVQLTEQLQALVTTTPTPSHNQVVFNSMPAVVPTNGGENARPL